MRGLVTILPLLVLLALVPSAGVAATPGVTDGAPASGAARPAVSGGAPAPGAAARPSPAVRPVPGRVLRGFEPPAHPYGPGHRGVALRAAPGQVVRAALPGTVRFSGEVARRGWVTVDHGAGLHTTYGWLDDRVVSRGERVRAGQVLGRLDARAEHLHWGARLHGEYLDPLLLLGRWRVRLVPLE